MNHPRLPALLLAALVLALPTLIETKSARSSDTFPLMSRGINTSENRPASPNRIAQDDPDTLPTPQQVQTAAQQITVRVTSASNGGSGVLVAKKGTTYLVLTNKHVVGRDTQFQIQTPDGQKHTAKLLPNTKIDPKYDITLLQFTSTQTYALANLDKDTTPLAENRSIYSVGYPYDSAKMRISVGTVTQLSDVPLEDGTQIGYKIAKNSPDIKQGMSGGPIVDGQGVLLGINTIGSYPILPNYTYFDGSRPTAKRAAEYRAANWGVPVYNLLTQLDANILYGYDNFPKVQRQVTPTGYMAKLNRETRQQTVRIEDSAGNGSGVIIAKQGNTYYVLTAKHVVETPARDKQPKQRLTGIKVITHAQETYQIQPSDINLADGADLAIVKFTSTTNYPVAKLGNYSPLENATVFAGGYPARGKIDSPLWQWQLNPGSIQEKERGQFQAQDKLSFSNGYDLIYSSISYGGMSGGPVFDTEGRVIGIHGKAEGENRDGKDLILGQSLGISIQTFLGLKELKLPNTLKLDARTARTLTQPEVETVNVVLENIAEPQADSDGAQWLQYGNQLYRIRQYAKAVVAFDKAIAKDKQYKLLGNYGKALALASAGDKQAGLTAINAAISAVEPIDKGRYYYLWTYQSLIFRELGKYDEALVAIDVAIKSEPNELLLLNEKVEIFTKKKQYSAAIAILDSIIKIQSESKRGSASAYAYYNRGTIKYELEQKQVAIADYDRAIAINSNFAQAYVNRGVAKSDLGQKQAAIIDYNRAIAINPNLAQAYYNRGTIKYELEQKEAAITDFDRAIAINPNYAEAYSNRGVIKAALGQNQVAITDYDRAIDINSNYAEAHYNRGNAKSKLGQNQAAIIDYNRAIDINSNYAEAYVNRGNAKSKLGQKQTAIIDYNRAIAINPNFAQAYGIRGFTKYQLGQKQAAIDDLTTAAQLYRQQERMDLYERLIGAIKEIKG